MTNVDVCGQVAQEHTCSPVKRVQCIPVLSESFVPPCACPQTLSFFILCSPSVDFLFAKTSTPLPANPDLTVGCCGARRLSRAGLDVPRSLSLSYWKKIVVKARHVHRRDDDSALVDSRLRMQSSILVLSSEDAVLLLYDASTARVLADICLLSITTSLFFFFKHFALDVVVFNKKVSLAMSLYKQCKDTPPVCREVCVLLEFSMQRRRRVPRCSLMAPVQMRSAQDFVDRCHPCAGR